MADRIYTLEDRAITAAQRAYARTGVKASILLAHFAKVTYYGKVITFDLKEIDQWFMTVAKTFKEQPENYEPQLLRILLAHNFGQYDYKDHTRLFHTIIKVLAALLGGAVIFSLALLSK